MKKKYLFLILILFSCSRAPLEGPKNSLRFTELPKDFKDHLNFKSFKEALNKTIKVIEAKPDSLMIFGKRALTAESYAKALLELKGLKNKRELILKVEELFDCYEVYGQGQWGEIFLTSYFTPILKGRRRPWGKYTYPLYPLPKDLILLPLEKFKEEMPHLKLSYGRSLLRGRVIQGIYGPELGPYYTKKEIDGDNKALKNLKPLAYVDPIDGAILQIQGSGGISFPGEENFYIGYAGQNGHPYESIGKFLLDVIPREKMNLESIETYLRSLPKTKQDEILFKNPSYVFFRPLLRPPVTTLGAEVTAGRTLAIDAKLFPLGSLVYLGPVEEQAPVGRFAFAQDTGGAIKGPGRADLYWGMGPQARLSAGKVKHKAKLYFFVPKELKGL